MKQRRNELGQFLKNVENDPQANGGFRAEANLWSGLLWILYRIIPIALILFVFWRAFKIRKYVDSFLIEVACGEDCVCSCPPFLNQQPVALTSSPPPAPEKASSKNDL